MGDSDQAADLTAGRGVAVLELLGAEIAESGVETAAFVDLVDKSRKVACDVSEGLVGHWIDGFEVLSRQRSPASLS